MVKFSIKNEITPTYVQNFKAWQMWSVAVSANGFEQGYSDRFLAMIDTGAKHVSISSYRMQRILKDIFDKNGKTLQPICHVESMGIVGELIKTPVYILPHLYIDKMHFTDVLVVVPDTSNFDCLIGRSILHQCVLTCDPETDMMCFDFKDSLKQGKQKLNGIDVFGEIKLFAEFGLGS